MEMTVDMLRAALLDTEGDRIVKIYANGSMDADVAEVHIDEVNENRKVATVTIVTENADNHLKQLLDAYFENRLPVEMNDFGFVRQTMTTEDIIDQLSPMMDVGKRDLMDYMSNHGYQIRQQVDGLPRWVLYTNIKIE